MSHHNHEDKVQAAIEAARHRTVPGTATALMFAGMGWGVLSLLGGLFGGHAGWTLGGVIVALVIGLGITQGGIVFAGIMVGTQARWGRPLKRVAEAFALALPIVYLMIVAFLFLGLKVYPWHPETITGAPIALAPHAPEAPASKEIWLNPATFPVRLSLCIGFMVLLDLIFLRASLRPDLIAARKKLGAQHGAFWWGWIIGSETDEKKAAEAGLATQHNLVPVLGMTYALVMSMVAFDMIMSLDPWWFSNMFGGWIFMSSLWMTLNFLSAFVLIGRDWLGLGDWVTKKTTHDLGRFILAGCMFWAYTLYAQILPIYYTDVPEETGFLLVRLMLPQWNPLSKIVAITCFIAPFTILLSRGIKKMRWPFVALNALILSGLFLERSLLVMPSVWLEDAVPWGQFLLINGGLWVGMLSLIAFVASKALASMPAVPVTDENLADHPWDEHVHALGHHGH
jgi:hypothetical protein